MKIHEKINDWVIPALLGFAVYYLHTMSDEMQKMSNTLSVAVFRADNLDDRVKKIEEDRRLGYRTQK